MIDIRKLAARALLAMSFAAAAHGVSAQTYPSRPVTWIVPFAAGGPTDALARAIAERVARELGQPIVIDNAPGAGGTVGAAKASRAVPDGYTMLVGHMGYMGAAPALYKKLAYDPVKDFAPISLMTISGIALAVHPSVPAKDLKGFVTYAKSKSGGVNYGSAGGGTSSQLSGELFNQLTGARLVHIPYKGAGPVLQDVMNGEIQYGLVSMAAATPALKAGKVSAMAQTRSRRSAAHPTVPTLAEQGFPDFEATAWYGLVGPGRLPRGLAQRFNEEANQVLALPDVQARLKGLGVEDGGGSIEKFAGFMRAEIARWSKVVKQGNLRP